MFEALFEIVRGSDEIVFYQRPGGVPMVEVSVHGVHERSSLQVDPRGLSDEALLRAVKVALDELHGDH